LDIKFFHKGNNSPRLHRPSFTEHPIGKKFIKIKRTQRFFSGAPLRFFNSINSFFAYAFIHYRFNSIIYKEFEKYNGIIYNLDVEEDESYIVENIGIVHNCRCYVEPLTADSPEMKDLETTDKKTRAELNEHVHEDFKHNSGMDGSVWGRWLKMKLQGMPEEETAKLKKLAQQ